METAEDSWVGEKESQERAENSGEGAEDVMFW